MAPGTLSESCSDCFSHELVGESPGDLPTAGDSKAAFLPLSCKRQQLSKESLLLFKHQSDKVGQQARGHVLPHPRHLVNGLSVLFAKQQEESQIAATQM